MKNLYYFVIAAVVFVACEKSQEQKADELIRESLKKTLFKPETYKPIDTKVDSAFSPYDDPELYKELTKLGNLDSEYRELEEEAKDAKTSMSIWSGPYQSAFGRNQYQEAKEEYEKLSTQIENLKKKGDKQFEKVMSMLQGDKKFIGYKAVHNYRADNNAGNTLIGNTVFFIDKDFTEVTFAAELEEYNQVQEGISQIMEKIKEAEE